MLISIKEAAKRLTVSRSTAYHLAETGILPSYKFGGIIRVDEADLQKYIDECRKTSSEQNRRGKTTGPAPTEHPKATHFKNLDGERLKKAWG